MGLVERPSGFVDPATCTSRCGRQLAAERFFGAAFVEFYAATRRSTSAGTLRAVVRPTTWEHYAIAANVRVVPALGGVVLQSLSSWGTSPTLEVDEHDCAPAR